MLDRHHQVGSEGTRPPVIPCSHKGQQNRRIEVPAGGGCALGPQGFPASLGWAMALQPQAERSGANRGCSESLTHLWDRTQDVGR